MKSSSRLFPAQLIIAEVLGGFAEDVYLIKPQNSPDLSVQIAVTHLSLSQKDSAGDVCSLNQSESVDTQHKPALVLVHGSYQNRRLWFSPGCTAFVEKLLAAGFDLWLMEHRGHGMSPQNQHYDQNIIEDYARYDIPAVNAFVHEKTGSRPSWIGYGEGAGAVLMAIACGALNEEDINEVTGVGSPYGLTSAARLPLSHWWMRPFSAMGENAEKLGPEAEPWSLRKQLLLESSWLSARGQGILKVDVWQRLKDSRIPLQWYGHCDTLAELDPGLLALYREHGLQLLDCTVDLQLLSPENIQSTLRDQSKVQSLLKSFNAAMERASHELLPPRKTASA